MSMRTRFYLGPVARVKVSREPAQSAVPGFPSGGKRKVLQLVRQGEVPNLVEAVEHYDLFDGSEALTSALSCDEKHRLFTPNVDRKGVKCRYFDDNDGPEEVFDEKQMRSERAAFLQAFENEIVELKSTYGVVEIVWMLCSEVL